MPRKELDNELSDIMKYDIGELRIAFPSTRGVYMLPCTLPIFEKLYPRVRLYVHEADSGQLESLLLDGSIDLAFFTLPLQSPELDYVEISREEVVLAMSSDHPLAKTGVKRDGCRYPWIDLKTAAGERFILQKSDQRTRKTADQLFKNAGISPENILEIRNIQASVQLAARRLRRHFRRRDPFKAYSLFACRFLRRLPLYHHKLRGRLPERRLQVFLYAGLYPCRERVHLIREYSKFHKDFLIFFRVILWNVHTFDKTSWHNNIISQGDNQSLI